MNPELDKKLVAKYPKIFVNRNEDMHDTAMCWGFECGDGWYKIIDRLCAQLQWNTDKNNTDYVIENLFLRKWIPRLFKIIDYIPVHYDFNKKRIKRTPLTYLRSFLWDWFGSICEKTKYIQIISDRYPQIVASQVKEKFGGLRFYVEGATDRQYAQIDLVESLSNYVCERCGSMSHVGRTTGWITTLCKECAAQQNKEWKEYGEGE